MSAKRRTIKRSAVEPVNVTREQIRDAVRSVSTSRTGETPKLTYEELAEAAEQIKAVPEDE